MADNKQYSGWLNYFRPTIFIKTFSDINIPLLKKSGYKLLICDLDNTLSPHFTKFPTRKVMEFCNTVHEVGLKLAIVSNNNKKRVYTYTSLLKPDAVIASAKKPLKRRIIKLMNSFDAMPDETIFIGDQFITDVWTANRVGAKSILVLPITSSENDSSSSWLIHFLDKVIYRKLEHGSSFKSW